MRHVAKGLKKAHGKSFRFANFIRSQLLAKIVEHESTWGEFAQSAFFSFLFSFRVPSEALQLRRAFDDDPLTVFAPQREKAIIGVRFDGAEPFLIVNLAWRKNLPGGCILRRPCFCNLANPKAKKLRPVHIFWRNIRRRVDPGAPLFVAVNRRNFNRTLKAVLARMGIPEAERYSSRAFRRGTSQELKEPGSPWSVVASSGIWHSPALRGYLDMSRAVEVGAQQLFDVDMDSVSEDEDGLP